jgi:hypothetical protein
MTPNSSPTRVDWLARCQRGVLDFRLSGDPLELPSAVWIARTLEYYAQRRADWPQRPATPTAPPDAASRSPAPPQRPDGPAAQPPRHPDDPCFDRPDLFA